VLAKGTSISGTANTPATIRAIPFRPVLHVPDLNRAYVTEPIRATLAAIWSQYPLRAWVTHSMHRVDPMCHPLTQVVLTAQHTNRTTTRYILLTVQNQTISLLALIEGNGHDPDACGSRVHRRPLAQTASERFPRLLSLRPSRLREKKNDQWQGINFGGRRSSNLLFW
jgi:hypothetical protein